VFYRVVNQKIRWVSYPPNKPSLGVPFQSQADRPIKDVDGGEACDPDSPNFVDDLYFRVVKLMNFNFPPRRPGGTQLA